MKREQLQLWNILSFNPKNTDVEEHIDLINMLDDMVDQKEEAKMEKFIEVPTMIQTHLIICKDWAAVKDKAKSLEHIMWKCQLLRCPHLQQVQQYQDYIPISHTWLIKMKKKYPQHLRGQNQSKPEVEINLKVNLKVTDKTHQKT